MSYFLYVFSAEDTYKKEFPTGPDAFSAVSDIGNSLKEDEIDETAVVISKGELTTEFLDNHNNKVKEYFSIEKSQRTSSLARFLRN